MNHTDYAVSKSGALKNGFNRFTRIFFI